MNDRDAETDLGNIETFFFFDHYRSFINMSASVEDERAFDPQLDYGGYKFGVSVGLAINKPVKGSALNLETAWRDRDYDNLTTSIGMKRKDESLTVGIGLETPVNDTMKFLTSYKYVDHSSNLPVSDYDEQTISVEFSSEF